MYMHFIAPFSGLRNWPFGMAIICRSTDLSICRTTNMGLKIMKKKKRKKTVCLSSAKINIIFDGAVTAKVKLFFLSCKEIQTTKIAITGLYLWIDHRNVLLTIFSRENSQISLCVTEIRNYCPIKKNVRLRRANTDLETNSFRKKIKCGFCFVMIFHDYKVHIRRSTDR